MNNPNAEIFAGAAIGMALLDTLVAKGIIEKADVITILAKAQGHLANVGTPDAVAAARHIGDVIYGKHNL